MGTTQFDDASYLDQVRKLTGQSLGSVTGACGIAGFMHLLTVAVERDLARFGEPTSLNTVACGPGCSSCCMVNVAVLLPEAIAIAWTVQRQLTPSRLTALRERLHALHIATCGLDDEERLFVRAPCAFLDPAGWCTIHRVRPLLCRSLTSVDANDCREAITGIALGDAPQILINLFQKSLLDAAYRGLADGLIDQGLDDRPFRLTSAVRLFLADPAAVRRFVGGERLVCS